MSRLDEQRGLKCRTQKPWYKVVNLREELRDGRPLDASEFEVHLDHIRDGQAHPDYQDPALFNMSIQFGGGKTHVLAQIPGRQRDRIFLFRRYIDLFRDRGDGG